jgi:hypothetical protein
VVSVVCPVHGVYSILFLKFLFDGYFVGFIIKFFIGLFGVR